MALVLADRVQVTTSTTGTVTLTLGSVVTGFQDFTVIGDGNTTYYAITNSTAWEVGVGTYTASGTTLSRDTVLSNSNGNTSPITLSGDSNVFVTYPAVAASDAALPTQSGNAGKFLQTDGSDTTWEAALSITGGSLTGGLNLARSTITQHATTMDLWALANTIDGTGSAVTITAIANAPQAGARRTLYPLVNTVITDNAMFDVDGGSTYTTLEGDSLEFEAVTVSTYKVHIIKADGTAVVSSFVNNVLLNADFRINQRAYVSAATLAAGAYGHDRFKAGASGGNYSFTQLNSSTQVTIASGKSLIQVVENKNVVGGSYVLSWTGTALARVGVNSATPSGTFVVSPILITGQTAGSTMSVEFNAGTLNTAQLELGTVATPFERRVFGLELALCQPYFEKSYDIAAVPGAAGGNVAGMHQSGTITVWLLSGSIIYFKVTKRAVPTIVFYSPENGVSGMAAEVNAASAFVANRSVTTTSTSQSGFNTQAAGGAFVVGNQERYQWTATSEL